MDLSIPLIGLLGFVGYNFSSQGIVKRDLAKERNKISEEELPSQTNIYNSVYSKKINMDNIKLLDKRDKMSKTPETTNIIPNLWNSYCQYKCDNKDPRDFTNSILPSVTNNKIIPDISSSAMFNTPNIIGNNIRTNKLESGGFEPVIKEAFSNFTPDNISELTGLKIDTNHTNMVPFFGGKIKQNMDLSSSAGGIIDRYNGCEKAKKQEVLPMFKSMPENVFGSQIKQDRTRYIQSNLKTSLTPTIAIKEAPLPPQVLRPKYKTQEQLNINYRVTNKPVAPNVGVSNSQLQRGILGEFFKNKPETTWEIGPERYLPGSTVSAPRVRENFTNGGENIAEKNYGMRPAGFSIPAGKVGVYNENGDYKNVDPLASRVRIDTRNTDNNTGIRNATSLNKRINVLSRDSYKSRDNERTTTNHSILLPAGDSSKGQYQAYTQEAKVTNKQNNLFSYIGNAKNEIPSMPDQTADLNPTRVANRPTIENYIGNGKINGGNKSYEVNVEIRNNKESINNLRNYMHEIGIGSKVTTGSCDINIRTKEDDNKNSVLNFGHLIPNNPDPCNFPEQQVKVSRDITETDHSNRNSEFFIEQLKDNPYCQDILM